MDLVPGRYTLQESINFEEYMKACGVSYVIRKIALASSPATEIRVDGDQWTITTAIPFKAATISFKLGEEFLQDLPDGSGRKVMATIDIEDNVMKHVQVLKNGEIWNVERIFTEDGMKITLTARGETCFRIYKRV